MDHVDDSDRPEGARGFAPRFGVLDGDAERLIEHVVALHDRGEIEKTPGVPLYASHYDAARDWLVDAYCARGLWTQVERYFTRDADSVLSPLGEAELEIMARLAAAGRPDAARRMRRAHCANLRANFWVYVDWRRKGFKPHPGLREPEDVQRAAHEKTIARIPDLKAEYLPQLQEGRAACARLGADARELALWDRWIAEMAAEEKARRTDRPDPAKMDEDLFWALLGTDADGPAAERLAALPDRLAAYRPAEIRRFGMMALEKLEAAYRTDIWALACLLRGGCSDDAFDGFRAGLILAGRDAYARALADPDGFDPAIPVSGDLPALLDAAPQAHELRAGAPMRPLRAMKMKLKGPAWDEAEFAANLPRIAAAMDTAPEAP